MTVGRVCSSVVTLTAAVLALVEPAAAFEYLGFRMGMTEAEVLSAARRNGYQLRPVDTGYIWEMTGRGSRSGYASLCNGKLFAVGTTFDANFHVFIGLVRERQDHYGEPEWKVIQSYAYDGQQLSTLEVKWEDPIGQFQPSVSLTSYGATTPTPRVTVSYSGHKVMCRRSDGDPSTSTATPRR
jgi:hypothetical protein